jgi:hypothetical protein
MAEKPDMALFICVERMIWEWEEFADIHPKKKVFIRKPFS